MDRDELKKEIEDYLAWVDGMNLLTLDYDERAEGILSLLAPELEKAAKWDKFHSYIKGECTLCPACGACMHVNYCILNTVEYDILTGLLKPMLKYDALEEPR